MKRLNFRPWNYKKSPRPNKRTRAKSRGTTFLHSLLTQTAFQVHASCKIIQSICEYSDKITAAAPLQSTFAKSQVRCRAQRGIPYKLPLRLSPAGCSLWGFPQATSSLPSLLLYYMKYTNCFFVCQEILILL